MEYKYVGKNYNRPDAIGKVTGKAIYLDDVRLPGMLYAALHLPPRLGDTLAAFDAAPILAMPGVKKVLDLTPHMAQRSV